METQTGLTNDAHHSALAWSFWLSLTSLLKHHGVVWVFRTDTYQQSLATSAIVLMTYQGLLYRHSWIWPLDTCTREYRVKYKKSRYTLRRDISSAKEQYRDTVESTRTQGWTKNYDRLKKERQQCWVVDFQSTIVLSQKRLNISACTTVVSLLHHHKVLSSNIK